MLWEDVAFAIERRSRGLLERGKASGANGTLGEPYSPAPFLVNPTHRAPLGSPARVCIRCVRDASRQHVQMDVPANVAAVVVALLR